jgi:hypothetical protein
MTDTSNPAVSDPNPGNEEVENTTLLIESKEPASQEAPKEPAKEPAKVEVPDGEAVTFEPTGDVGLDMALEFLGKQGFSVEHPAMVAAGNGDFTILEALLAQKGVQGWDRMIALGKAGMERIAGNQKAETAKTLDIVTKAVGGAEEWGNIQKWAAANATPEERAAINAQLNAGGLSAKMAATYLADLYGKANNVNITPPDGSTFKGGGEKPPSSTGPMSAKEYTDAVNELHRRLGGRMEESPEYASLNQRRMQAMR